MSVTHSKVVETLMELVERTSSDIRDHVQIDNNAQSPEKQSDLKNQY
ncbi:hypothetical protein NT6N_09000 [Oceaniferula spumae]|uniref:Uncharacterized protein n=1 Tax=Oceaniferula spumae TaxID=2979115 RepID=A0AAT9FIM5_9BACT